MKSISKIVASMGLLGCLNNVASGAAIPGRLAGRDVLISDATVQTQSQGNPISAPNLPPNDYSGIELLHSTEKDLFAKFSPAKLTSLQFGAGEIYEGYCYRSPDGRYMAFNLYAFSQFDAIQLSTDSLGTHCQDTPARLDRCVGPYCLGQTRAEVERQLGVKLGGSTGGEHGLVCAYFDYSAPMSADERKKFEEFNLTQVPVKHNLWFRFKDDRLSYIGVWRWEDLP